MKPEQFEIIYGARNETLVDKMKTDPLSGILAVSEVLLKTARPIIGAAKYAGELIMIVSTKPKTPNRTNGSYSALD